MPGSEWTTDDFFIGVCACTNQIAGAGKFQGGAGQIIALRNDTGGLVNAALFGSRTSLPSRGFGGGRDGSLRLLFVDGKPVEPKSRIDIKPGSVIELHEAGGGGFGDPAARGVDHVKRDLDADLVSPDYVRQHYARQASEILGQRET